MRPVRQREQGRKRYAGMDGGKSCGGDLARNYGIPSVTEDLLVRGSSKTRSNFDEEGAS